MNYVIRSSAWIVFGCYACAPTTETAPPNPVLESDAPSSTTHTILQIGGGDGSTDSEANDVAATDVGDGAQSDGATSSTTQFLVLRVGTTTTTLNQTNAVATFVEVRNISDGSVVGAPLPVATTITTANGQYPLTLSGTPGEGALALSDYGHYVTFAGYNKTIGDSIAGDTSATIGSVDSNIQVVDTSVVDNNSTTGFKTIYGAVRYSANYWVLSDQGVDYLVGGADAGAPTRFANSPTFGELQIVGGVMFATEATGGIWSAGNTLPEGGAAGSPLWSELVGTNVSTNYSDGFLFVTVGTNTAATRLYIANSQYGLQRWNFDAGSQAWILSMTIYMTSGVRHVTGFLNDDLASVTLIFTTADGSQILKMIDDGVTAAPPTTILATSPSVNNLQYLGVSLTPY